MTLRVAAMGECMIELRRNAQGDFTAGFGGDTLNTAIYMARLGLAADYVTALGTDSFSLAMQAAWQEEGVGIGHVLAVPDRLPGLYMIDTDAAGERRFLYWRESAPARDLFRLPGSPALIEALAAYDLLYLSGISLAVWGEEGRACLLPLLDRLRQRGGRVAFDTNWRPALWPGKEAARAAYRAVLERSDTVLAGVGELRDLFGDPDMPSVLGRLRGFNPREIVVKLDPPGCIVCADGVETAVPAERGIVPVDTTAAGDSFAAAYLAARLRGQSPIQAVRLGHHLAARVIQCPGAIIPRPAMPPVTQGAL